MSQDPIKYIVGNQTNNVGTNSNNQPGKRQSVFPKAGHVHIGNIKDGEESAPVQNDESNPDGSQVAWPKINFAGLYFSKLCPIGTTRWEGKDHFKQSVSLEYGSDPVPSKVTYAPGVGDQYQHEYVFYGTLGPKDNPSLTYSAPVCNEFQQALGTVELRIKTGSLVYRFPQEDGTTKVVLYRPPQMRLDYRCAGCFLVFIESNEGTVKLTKRLDASLLVKYCQYKDGRKFKAYFDAKGNLLATPKVPLTITYADGSMIKLHQVKERTAIFEGFLFDATGKPVEKVLWKAELNVLQFQNFKTKEIRAELFYLNEDEELPAFIPGRYDPDRGRFEEDGANGEVIIRTIAPGRVDIRLPNGMVRFRDDNNVGHIAYSLPNGEAAVFNADGNGIRLDQNNHAMMFAPSGAHMCITAANVSSFMDATKAYTDRRDWAQLLLQFRSQPAMLDAFVNQLKQLNTITVLPEARLQALISCLLHLVAYRAEIYQGRMGSCNVTVIERDMAAIVPAKLVETIYLALSTGSVTLASGRKFTVDVANLLIRTASGRDIAGQIIQDIMLQVATQMRRVDVDGDGVLDRIIFRDTPDGGGEDLKCDPLDNDGNGCSIDGAVPPTEVVEFPGLDDSLIREVCSEFTGVEFETKEITTIEELEEACLDNPEVIVVVDGGKPPITTIDENPDAESAPNHVITVNGVFRDAKTGKCLVSFRNQWGLDADHSSPSTRVDAAAFISNCSIEWSNFEPNQAPGKRARIIVRKKVASATTDDQSKA